MLRRTVVLGITAVLCVAMPASADAQDPPHRSGFFIGLGIGAGSFGCEGCGGREGGVAGHLSGGWTLTPQLLLAGEISGLTRREGGGRLIHANVSAVAQLYPMIESGLFLRAGIGGSKRRVSASGASLSYTFDENGFGATAGAGYDIRLGSNLSLSPYAIFAWGGFDSGNANHFQGGLGVTWH